MKRIIILVLAIVPSLWWLYFFTAHALTFPDPNLEAAIRDELSKPEGPITDEDLAGLEELRADWLWISELTGIERCVNLEFLDLEDNYITDISPLSSLTNLQVLWLGENYISDVSPLSGLTNLSDLELYENRISDISPLVMNAGLGEGDYIDLEENPLNDEAYDIHIPALQKRGVDLDFDTRRVAPGLEAAIREALNKPEGPITDEEFSELDYLDASSRIIDDLTGIERCINLESLDLEDNLITDISPLRRLINLQSLHLYNNLISDISPLSGLINLQSLDLWHNPISDISPLGGLINLQSLDLDENQISDIRPLSGLINLQSLDLSRNPISDISPLSGLINLQSLYLSRNPISDINPLSGLINLQSLYLSRNPVSDISLLSGLINLQSLYLWGNQISDISPLSGLINLQELGLSGNPISDISPLSGLINLQELYLDDNQISDISPLSGLINLQELGLQGNQISDISPLSGLINLQGLDLDGNQISDISPLSGLINLQGLDLQGNQISDIGPLSGLINLEWVDLHGNPLNDAAYTVYVPALRARGVDVWLGEPPTDTFPPIVTDSSPRNGAKGVDPSAINRDGIVITFSEPIDTQRVQITLEAGDETLTWQRAWTDGNTKLTMAPTVGNELRFETGYRVTLSQVADMAGNSAAEIIITFTTEAATPTVKTTFTLGILTVGADSITQISQRIWQATGNVVINDFLHLTGDVTLDERNQSLAGSGQVYMTRVLYLGKVVLFEADEFSFNANLGELVNQTRLETKFDIGFLKYGLTSLKLVAQGVEVGGKVALPRGMHLGSIGEESFVGAELRITTDEGIQLLAGKLELSDVRLGASGYKFDTLSLEYDRQESMWEGEAVLVVPHLFTIEAAVGIKDGRLNRVGIGADNLNNTKPILFVGPIPIVFLQRIYGELDELAPGPPPIILKGQTAFTGGPQIGDYFAIRVDLGVTIDTSGELVGEGDIYVITKDGHIAGGKVVLSAKTGLTIEGELKILAIIRARGKLRLDLKNNFKGKLQGILACPERWPVIGGMEFGYVVLYVDNTRIVAGVEVAWFEIGISYDAEGFHVAHNLEEVRRISFAPTARIHGRGIMRAPSQQIITIPEGVPLALFRVSWSQGDTDFDLIAPDGTRITPDIVATDPDRYFYRKNLAIPEAYYAVKTPQPGVWQVQIPDAANLGAYSITVYGGNEAPKISMQPPSLSGKTATLRWMDKDADDDAQVSLYYDTDMQGADGSTIITGISEDDESDSFVWDISDVPSSVYYVYAKIDDGRNPPSFSYAPAPITVSQAEAPAAPANLQGKVTDDGGGIELVWDAVEGVEGYAIYSTDAPQTPGYADRFAVGQRTNYTLTDLAPGRTYRLAVAAYNADREESLPSAGIEVAFQTITGNNPPHIVSTPPTSGKAGFLYSYEVVAEDVDNDVVSFRLETSPQNAAISVNTGMVQWVPPSVQVGNQPFVVVVEDGHGGMGRQSFTVTVSERSNYRPEVMLLTPQAGAKLEGDALLTWQATDRDGDELSVALFYSVDGVHYWQLAGMLPNTGSYMWDTTQVRDSQSCRLQIVVSDGKVEAADLSEGSFSIKNNLAPWDINSDGVTDLLDLVLAALHFGETGPSVIGDVNGDGVVDTLDLAQVGSHFGEMKDATAPASLEDMSDIVMLIAKVRDRRLMLTLDADQWPTLYGLQYELDYDPSVLQLASVQSGERFQYGYSMPPILTSGYIRHALTQLGPPSPPARGEAVVITFDVTSPERLYQQSLHLHNIRLAHDSGRQLANSRAGMRLTLETILRPENTALLQNYPNPFNPDTWIPYQLREGSEVRIQIFSAPGELTRELELGYKPAGLYVSRDRAAYWDGRNEAGESAASGVYFYNIKAGDFSATRKMVARK